MDCVGLTLTLANAMNNSSSVAIAAKFAVNFASENKEIQASAAPGILVVVSKV
jgi:hypothetical protein